MTLSRVRVREAEAKPVYMEMECKVRPDESKALWLASGDTLSQAKNEPQSCSLLILYEM